MRALLAVLALTASTFAAKPLADEALVPTGDVPRLVDEAEEAGVSHVYDGPWEYFVGGGVAAFDCNGDRFPDLVMAGGKRPARLFVNRSGPGESLRFEARDLGIGERQAEKVTGVYPLDGDGDGHRDLVLLRVGRNLLLKGGPDCAFKVAGREWSYDGGRAWTTAFAATWEEGQRYPTLAFGNYVDRSAPGSPWGTCHENDLFRPDGDEAPRYGERTPLSPGHCALSMIFTDWNRSGIESLRVTNDRHYYCGGEEQLWQLKPERPPRLYTVSEGWQHLKIWGMGIAEADLDADGYPEYALTSMGDTKLQRLDEEADEDRPTYRDVAYESGATAHRPYTGDDLKPSTGWHVQFGDMNNDSLADLFIAKGNVEAMPDFAAVDPDNLLIGLWDGRYAEGGAMAGIDRPTRGRGGAMVDLDLDGLLDLVVVNRSAPAAIFRNRGMPAPHGERPGGNWLMVELDQEKGNRDAVGAVVHARVGDRTIVRRVTVGGGHASGQNGWIHFGLGTSERASLRIRWPDGEWSHPYRVFANQFAVVRRGAEAAAYWYPPERGD